MFKKIAIIVMCSTLVFSGCATSNNSIDVSKNPENTGSEQQMEKQETPSVTDKIIGYTAGVFVAVFMITTIVLAGKASSN